MIKIMTKYVARKYHALDASASIRKQSFEKLFAFLMEVSAGRETNLSRDKMAGLRGVVLHGSPHSLTLGFKATYCLTIRNLTQTKPLLFLTICV